jgi:glycosyltransferase involved in cell wall biosynthesis
MMNRKTMVMLSGALLILGGVAFTVLKSYASERPLVVIIPSYKNAAYYKRNLSSVFSQNYSNYRVIYIDDCSPDGTGRLVEAFIKKNGQEHRVTLIKNTERHGPLYNLYHAMYLCKDDEITVTCDGDDWFAHNGVLARINKAYTDGKTWMTYGNYEVYPKTVASICASIPEYVRLTNGYRKYAWVTSHVRTCYAWLFKKIKIEDLQDNGQFLPVTGDMALMFPMLEMASSHVTFIPDILYMYNIETPINEFKEHLSQQQYYDRFLRAKVPYQPLDKKDAIRTDFVDFDRSMYSAPFINAANLKSDMRMYGLFRYLFMKNYPDVLQPATEPKIPHIVHVIWLGGKLPQRFEGFVQSWYDKQPEWTQIFWTDSPENYDRGQLVTSFDELNAALRGKTAKRLVVDVRNLVFDNKVFYDKSQNYGCRSDILKWEAVYRYGGVYVDTDFECLKPLDQLHLVYDFYTGIQPLDTAFFQLGAALFAARPGHPIMKACVEGIKHNQNIPMIIAQTGPIHFTRCFLQAADKNGNIDIAFPPTYFYPKGCTQKEEPAHVWQKPESLAVHHWAESWIKPEGMVRK